MANEFVARRGIIAQSGGARITGSLLVSGTIDATGYNIIANSITGSFSGSIGTATTASYVAWSNIDGEPSGLVSSSTQIDYNSIQNKLSGVISSSTQFNALTGTSASYALTASFASNANIPAGTVSSSAQYPGWVTSSTQIVWSSVNYNSGIVSSSAQVAPLLPGGTVSSSGQVSITATTGYSTFSSSIATKNDLQDVSINALNAATSSYAINSTIQSQLAGVVSSSAQVKPLLPGGTVTSSAQYPGWVTASSQIDYNSIQNKLTGVVSSSAQVAPLLPNGTVSSSAQYPGWVTSSTQIVWSSVNYNSGIISSSAQTVASIAGQQIAPSAVSSSGGLSGSFIQVSGNGIIGGNLNVIGTLTATSQSIQYVTSSQFNVATNRIIVNTDNSLRFGGISVVDSGSVGKSGSLYWDSLGDRWIYEDVSGGTYSSAILVAGPKNTGTTGNERGLLEGRVPVASGDDHIDTAAASSSIRVDFPSRLTHVEAGLFITGALTANGTVTLAGIPSSSAQIKILLPADTVTSSTQVKAFLPGGTLSSSAQYPGWVTASSQVDITATTNYTTFSSSLATVDAGQTTRIDNLASLTSSYAINSTIQSQLAGVVSSSAQVKPLLPGGTVTSSAQYPGWVTASSQIDYNSIQNKLSGVVSSSAQVAPLLPNGTVSSSAQYPGWVTASSQIALASITGTTFAASNFTFPQQLTVSGVLSGSTSAFLNNTLYSGSTVTGIVGPVNNQVVATITTGSFTAGYFDYSINDGTNYRAGTVMSVWSPSTIEFTDTSTADIGNTAQASFSVDVVSGVARLKFTNVSGTWSVKTAIRSL